MKTLNTEIGHYLSIKLDSELFAINVHKVLEVLEMQPVTKVPNVSAFIKGVINFRGEILPVIDARHGAGFYQRGTGYDQSRSRPAVADIAVGDHSHCRGGDGDGRDENW